MLLLPLVSPAMLSNFLSSILILRLPSEILGLTLGGRHLASPKGLLDFELPQAIGF